MKDGGEGCGGSVNDERVVKLNTYGVHTPCVYT